MATGKKQNGRCPFPKKAKFRAIQHWLPTPNCYRHYWVFEHRACWDFLLSSKSIRVGGEKGPGALATDIRSWQWWHRQSGGFATTLHWRKLSLVLVLVNFGNCSGVFVVHHRWPPCPWVSVSLHRCPWLLMGVHWCLWESIAWQRAGPWSNQCPSLLPTPLDHALPPAVTVRRIRCDHPCKKCDTKDSKVDPGGGERHEETRSSAHPSSAAFLPLIYLHQCTQLQTTFPGTIPIGWTNCIPSK